jgi:hypothetical protein
LHGTPSGSTPFLFLQILLVLPLCVAATPVHIGNLISNLFHKTPHMSSSTEQAFLEHLIAKQVSPCLMKSEGSLPFGRSPPLHSIPRKINLNIHLLTPYFSNILKLSFHLRLNTSDFFPWGFRAKVLDMFMRATCPVLHLSVFGRIKWHKKSAHYFIMILHIMFSVNHDARFEVLTVMRIHVVFLVVTPCSNVVGY